MLAIRVGWFGLVGVAGGMGRRVGRLLDGRLACGLKVGGVIRLLGGGSVEACSRSSVSSFMNFGVAVRGECPLLSVFLFRACSRFSGT